MGKSRYGFIIGTIALTMLLVTSSASAVPYESNFTTDTLDASLNLEFVNVVAGLDLATYTNIFVFGGHDGSNMPIDDSASGFSETAAWLLVYANLGDFATYLNRIPFDAPDGLSLMLAYPSSVSSTLTKAASAVALVEAEYSITMDLIFFEGGIGQVDYYIFFSAIDTFSQIAADVKGIDNDGFSLLIDDAKVTAAPVGWAMYGVRKLSGTRVAMHGVGWVDDNGLTKSGSVYTLSSDNVLGADIVPAVTPSDGLSRVRYSFPYPISPITNGITMPTSNPLPHVTGEMVWDLRHPISSYELTPVGDYKVEYELTVDPTFPNVQNKMSINQTKLNVDGTLEVLFDLTNIGEQDAKNINLSLPLGPDFGDIVDKNITIYTIKDGFSLNETDGAHFNLALETDIPISTPDFDFRLFNLTGWYNVVSNSSLAYWDYTTTQIDLFNGSASVLGTPYSVGLTLYSDNGFPTALIDAFNDKIIPYMPTGSVSSLNDLIGPLKANLDDALNQMFNQSFNALYQAEDKLIFDAGDFTLVQKEVAINAANTEMRYFLEKTIDTLAVGASQSISFRINEVPTTSDELALMEYIESTTSDGYPTAELISALQNYNEFMQYAFQGFGFDGRPISFNLPDDFTLDFDALFWSSTYGSLGMAFTYENDKGYPFFGLSNGQNVQIADDEAVIAATMELDKQNYVVGDPVVMSVNVTNNGDIEATDITVHLFHGTIGRDWRFERIDAIASIDVADLAAGSSAVVTWDGEANTYLGYHTVFAFVEFTSDAGQGPAELPDFLDLGITSFEGAGETTHFSMSTLSGALVLPEGFLPEPSIPEPLLTMTTQIIGDGVTAAGLSAGEEFTYKVTIVNDGDASTDASFSQVFDDSSLEYLSATTTEGTVTTSAGAVYVDGMTFAPGETITIEITFKLLGDSATLPPGILAYSVDGDSSLGASVDTGFSLEVSSTSSLVMSASSAAQQESQKSGSEDSSSSSFSASSSVGASVNTQGGSQSTVSSGVGFIGYGPELLGLMLIPLAIGAIYRKRKN